MRTTSTLLMLTISRIVNMEHEDTETKMMAINGIMQGHGVTWRTVNTVIIEAIGHTTGQMREGLHESYMAELGPFVSMQDYFIHQVNNGNDKIVTLCRRCMDFTLLESGNRVNMAENNGPY